MKIEIKSTTINSRNITSKKTGEIIQFVEQEAYAYTSDRNGHPHAYPSRIVVNAQENGQPYPVGFYTLSASSYMVDRFGKLELGRVRLEPLAAAAAPARTAA